MKRKPVFTHVKRPSLTVRKNIFRLVLSYVSVSFYTVLKCAVNVPADPMPCCLLCLLLWWTSHESESFGFLTETKLTGSCLWRSSPSPPLHPTPCPSPRHRGCKESAVSFLSGWKLPVFCSSTKDWNPKHLWNVDIRVISLNMSKSYCDGTFVAPPSAGLCCFTIG